ncbi:pyridoxamine 5'-phosphate oxidase family protein [Blastococcus sp. DSM 46786]|uniref:pyridoxamine 5'-phosphate oxidase family protein n=1 Tax=Blastococcus sp. DSM 46786 TaxID=1798227 RepID=UPI001113733C|nr:pyridoxamine 5'-phosphate oxidase family protein [Blastococcus sp. DSM 46786]
MAELLWRTPDGPPGAIGVVPLLLGGKPTVALPWAHVGTARAAAASDTAALVLSDPRLTGSRWTPLVATGRLTLVEDGDGDLFTEELLTQELRKHPPARALADSPMLRREHWWYLPRLVLVLEPADVVPGGRRDDPADVVLGVDDGGLHVGTVRVPDWAADPLPVADGPAGASGPAVLIGQELSVPDVERWTVHTTTGRYADGRLSGVRPAATRELEPVPGLFARMRRQRGLERACIQTLRAAGHG